MKPFVMECDIACFRALGVKIDKVGEYFVSNTGASNPILNCVYTFAGKDTEIESSATQIFREFNTQSLPFSWWIETTLESPGLKDVLKVHDKKLLGEFSGMLAEVSSIREAPKAHDLTVSRVSTQAELSAWGGVIAEAFEFNQFDANLYASLFERAGTNGPFYHLVGKRNGKVVSTGTILCTEEGAYIYNVATDEAERRKGYGSKITHELLKIAKQKNQARVALVSSQSAASIYRNLGFQEICRFSIYA